MNSSNLQKHQKDLDYILSKERELGNLRLQLEREKASSSSSQENILGDIELSKIQLADVNQVVKQKIQSISNKFNLQKHENELSEMIIQLQTAKDIQRKIMTQESKISSVKSALTVKNEQLHRDGKLYVTALNDLDAVTKEEEKSVENYERIEKNRLKASSDYLSLKENFEKEFSEFQILVENKHVDERRKAKLEHDNEIQIVEKQFQASL